MERLTLQEETAMRRLWAMGEATVKELLADYGESAPPYTTLASVLKNLEHKGYAAARRVGNTYLYAPLVSAADYKRHSLRQMVNSYFNNSYRELVSFFLKEKNLSREEFEELLRLVDDTDPDA